MDLFNRTLAYIYKLHDYYRQQAARWKYGCNIGEVLSLGAMVCVWIAQKAIEDTPPDAESMYQTANYYYLKEFIVDMERHLVVNLDGIIYQWNPFLNCSTLDDLVRSFDDMTNIFTYQNYTIKACRVDPNNTPHQLNFKNVYYQTKYYRMFSSRPEEIPQIARDKFRRDRDTYVSRTSSVICLRSEF
jgi:hypothetical protein